MKKNNYVDTSKLLVREIDRKVAKKMIVEYHYSKQWTKCSIALGLYQLTGKQHTFFDEPEERLIGTICYGDPIGRHSGASISESIPREAVFELVRLFVHDGYGNNITDAQIENLIRKTADTVYHPVGTCKMGNDKMAVVNEKLIVKGMRNLRVVDASIMPLIVSGNTNAPTIMIAEKAADLVIQAHQ